MIYPESHNQLMIGLIQKPPFIFIMRFRDVRNAISLSRKKGRYVFFIQTIVTGHAQPFFSSIRGDDRKVEDGFSCCSQENKCIIRKRIFESL